MNKKKATMFWAWASVNLGIIGLVAFTLYFTNSLWAFLGLLFLLTVKLKAINAECPKCGCQFVAKEKDDKDEND